MIFRSHEKRLILIFQSFFKTGCYEYLFLLIDIPSVLLLLGLL